MEPWEKLGNILLGIVEGVIAVVILSWIVIAIAMILQSWF